MPTRRSKPLYLGFYGSGSTPKKNSTALLDELLDGVEKVTFLIPATKGDYSDTVADIVEYGDARTDDKDDDLVVTYEVITDASTVKAENLSGLAEDAKKQTKATSGVGTAIVKEIATAIDEDSVDGRLIMLWPEDPNDDEIESFSEATDSDIPAFNLCNGLDPMKFEDDADGDEGAPVLPSDDELEEMSLAALRTLAEKMGVDEAEYAKKRKPAVIAALKAAGDADDSDSAEDTPDEKDDEPAPRARRSRSTAREEEPDEAQANPPQPDDEPGGDEGAFADVVAVSLIEGLPDHIRLAPATREVLRSMAADFAEALVIAVANEVRRPKSAGKPREDGTPAAPKKATRSRR